MTRDRIEETMNDQLTKSDLYSVATVGGPSSGSVRYEITGKGDPPAIEHKPSTNGQAPTSNMIDLAHTRFIITAWPDDRWPVETICWIESLMKDVTPAKPDYQVSVKKPHMVCARNYAIRECALKSDPSYEWFVFLDRDVRPCAGGNTTRFLDLEADVKSCQVEHTNKAAYSWPDDFHDPIWCTSRKVLEAIKPPWFMQLFNADGTEMAGCICNYFKTKVLAVGFSIAHGGWAEHDRDGSWCG